MIVITVLIFFSISNSLLPFIGKLKPIYVSDAVLCYDSKLSNLAESRPCCVIFVNFDQITMVHRQKKINSQFLKKKWNSWTSFSTNFRKFMAVYQGNFDQKKRRIYCMILCFLKWYCVFFNFKLRLIIDKKNVEYHFLKHNITFFLDFFGQILA